MARYTPPSPAAIRDITKDLAYIGVRVIPAARRNAGEETETPKVKMKTKTKAKTRTKKAPPAPLIFTFDKLCRAVGLKASYAGALKLVQANAKQINEETAEALAEAYVTAAVSTIKALLNRHLALNLKEITTRTPGGKRMGEPRWAISPQHTWRKSLNHQFFSQKINNGKKVLGYDTVDEFLKSGPHTVRAACALTLSNLPHYTRTVDKLSLQKQFQATLTALVRAA